VAHSEPSWWVDWRVRHTVEVLEKSISSSP
jgi:hypothetical protein